MCGVLCKRTVKKSVHKKDHNCEPIVKNRFMNNRFTHDRFMNHTLVLQGRPALRQVPGKSFGMPSLPVCVRVTTEGFFGGAFNFAWDEQAVWADGCVMDSSSPSCFGFDVSQGTQLTNCQNATWGSWERNCT